MKTAPFSMRLEATLKTRLEDEAKRRDRTASFVANRAIRLYFDELDRTHRELEEAFAEADKGVFISGEAVQKWMESWGTDHELPPPEPDIFPEPKTGKRVA